MSELYESDIVQSAFVTPRLYNDVDLSCPNGESYATAKSKEQYSISCGEDRKDYDSITTMRAFSLDECLNNCSGENECKGVLFDMSMSYGVSSESNRHDTDANSR